METTRDLKPYEPEMLRVYHARLIYAGRQVESFRQIFLRPFLLLFHNYPIKGYVLDLSPDGELEEAVRQTDLPKSIRTSLQVMRANDDDLAAQQSFWELTEDCDPGSLPNDVLLDVPPAKFPELAAACHLLASKWFFGGPERPEKAWSEETLQDEVSLADLSVWLTTCRFPHRLTSLLIGPKEQRDLFISTLSPMLWTWVSFMQLAEQYLNELWPWKDGPDLVFCRLDSFEAICNQRRYSRSICIISADDRQIAMNSVREKGLKSGPVRSNYPAVVLAWSPRSAKTLLPTWVTRTLARSEQQLPVENYYHPRPELEDQLEDLWKEGRPRVVGLIGFGGVGKTALLQQMLRKSLVTQEYTTTEAPQGIPTADALFVWDFNAQQFPDAFIRSFASYLNPGEGQAASAEECLSLIRDGLVRRQLRRVLLVMDGLDTIQRPRKNTVSVGELQSLPVLKLLEEIASGELGVTAIVATRLEPAELKERCGDGYVSLPVSALTVDDACQILRDCGGIGSDAQLGELARRFNCHVMTIYHLGRVLGDFYGGDLSAFAHRPQAGRKVLQTGIREVDEINRNFLQIFACYEEHLKDPELAVLKRVATLGMPLTTSEFNQIFSASGDELLAGELVGTTPERLQMSFEVLRERRLLNAYVGLGQPIQYAVHPTMSRYFAQAYMSDTVGLNTPDLYTLPPPTELDPGRSGEVRVRGTIRTRRSVVAPRGRQTNHPADSRVLDVLEKILVQIIRLGRNQEATLFYQRRMGGDEHLRTIGQHARLKRVKAWFSGKHS